MKVWIFIVSFSRDVEFLKYCLMSCDKFATGFAGIHVVVPFQDYHLFQWVEGYENTVLSGFTEDRANGMMHHEAEKMAADRWCQDADAILHLDSDCMFWEPVTPSDYFVDGKPVLYRERYSTLKNTLRLNWKKAVFDATGIDPEWETMVRHPAIHLRETYLLARNVMFAHTGKKQREYILGCRSDFPQTFAEFPTLGAVAISQIPGLYHFVNHDVLTPDGGYDYQRGRDKLVALWSHGGIDRYREQCESILR